MRRVVLESPEPQGALSLVPKAVKINGKRCSKCGGIKPISYFVRDKNRKDGRHPQCYSCVQAYKKKWKLRPEVIERNRKYQREFARNPERKRQVLAYQNARLPSGITRKKKFKIMSKYGLTEEKYLQILADQNGKCATCAFQFNDHSETQIDHCHATGIVRGILCKHCNRALGQVADSVEILAALIKYLRASR